MFSQETAERPIKPENTTLVGALNSCINLLVIQDIIVEMNRACSEVIDEWQKGPR